MRRGSPAPPCCLTGEDDIVIAPPGVRAVAHHIPDARVHSIPATGHSVYFRARRPVQRPARRLPSPRSAGAQVPIRNGAPILRRAASADKAVIRPVFGFSDGMFSISSANEAESASTSMR